MQRHSTPSMRKPRSPSTDASATRRSNSGIRTSNKDSFSAAANLVIKPSTPPGMPKPGTPPKMHTTQHFNSKSSLGPAEQARLTTTINASQGESVPVAIEVVSLSGNPIIKDTFLLGDKIIAMKQKVAVATGHPIFQQQLAWQGRVLENERTLLAHGFASEEAVVQLMLRSLPEPSELEDVKANMHAGLAAIEPLAQGSRRRGNAEVRELCSLCKPPHLCEQVCDAVLHLLVGVEPSIKVKRNGSPSDTTWKGGAVEMMRSGSFVKSLHDLPVFIDRGKCLPENVRAAKTRLQGVPGGSNEEKVNSAARCSIACSRLCGWALCMVEYFEAAAEISERFGANVCELQSPNATDK